MVKPKLPSIPDSLREDVRAAVEAQQSDRPVDVERMAEFVAGSDDRDLKAQMLADLPPPGSLDEATLAWASGCLLGADEVTACQHLNEMILDARHAGRMVSHEQCAPVLRDTLRALVEKVHFVLNHPSVQSAFMMSAIHGAEYDGPNVKDEMLAAQRLLGMPDELPKAVYPDRPSALVAYEDGKPLALVMVGTLKECFDFADRYPDENLVHCGNAKNWLHLPKWELPPPFEPREVDLAMIKRFRASTGCGLAEAKEILIETQGNEKKASRLLLERTGR